MKWTDIQIIEPRWMRRWKWEVFTLFGGTDWCFCILRRRMRNTQDYIDICDKSPTARPADHGEGGGRDE